MYRAESINNAQFRVPIDVVTGQLLELKVNPFAQQLCSVFSQNQNFMMFEDFIDMMSVLSERAPAQVIYLHNAKQLVRRDIRSGKGPLMNCRLFPK